ncbi:MAG: hypothetical protein CM1200mP22_26720 [Dehalococcoidia bacterium]|nr:MAG: hypothetical protein CM1200mP22_26720 [Dehalococcoidia bacterium]
MAIGHTRYSTSGSSELCNAQPLLVESQYGQLAVANNGNIINALQLKNQLQDEWSCTFNSTTDTEVVAQLLAHSTGATWEERVFQCMRQLEGAYSIVIQTKDTMIAARDPLGIRPMCLGKLNGGWIVASESCALDHLGPEFLRELKPGEVIIVDDSGLNTSIWSGGTGRSALCVFELIYFARPDSVMASQLVTRPARSWVHS